MRQRLLARGLVPRLLVLAACALIVAMFWTNDDMDGKPDVPRGNGQYLPILARGDGHMLYLMARSTALDLDWDFANDLQHFGDHWGQPIGPTGRKQIPHPIGPPLVWTPLIWIAEAGAVVVDAFGGDIPLHGYTLWHQRFVFLSSALFACGAALLGRALARHAIGGAWAPSYAAIAVLLGTSVTYYATYMPGYGHALDAGACGALLGYWALTIGRDDLRRFVVLGVLLGVAALVRVQNFALGIVVAIEVVAAIGRDLRQRAVDWRMRAVLGVARGALVLAVAGIVFVPQLYYWHLVYGRWFAQPQGTLYTRLAAPMILELLYGPRNGWFSSTPVAYLGVIGLGCLPRRARLVAVGLVAAVAVEVYLCSTIQDYWGMNAYGQRRMCSMTLPIVVGLAALLWRGGRLAARVRLPRAVAHGLALVVLAPMVAWNLWRVSKLSGGKAAPDGGEPACCGKVPMPVRGLAQAIYDRIGDPFEFPANLWFAIRHRVDLRRWDLAVGNYALIPPAASLVDGTLRYQHGSWRLGYPGSEPYLIAGEWSAVYEHDWPYRWTMSPTVRALVPNLVPLDQLVTISLAPGGARDVIVRWDGDVIASPALAAGWNTIQFRVDRMAVGEHELELEAVPAPLPAELEWPHPRAPVGVAISRLDFQLVSPPE